MRTRKVMRKKTRASFSQKALLFFVALRATENKNT